MNSDLVVLALMVGGANWAFRVLPIDPMRRETRPDGIVARFLASTGPAAIATLFVASVLPQIWPGPRDVLPLAVGTLVTIGAFFPRRSVVAGTLAGAAAYALTFWLAG